MPFCWFHKSVKLLADESSGWLSPTTRRHFANCARCRGHLEKHAVIERRLKRESLIDHQHPTPFLTGRIVSAIRRGAEAVSVPSGLKESGIRNSECLSKEIETMQRKRFVAFLGVVAAAVVLASYSPRVDAQRPGSATDGNWPLHNLDLAGSRFSTLDQINTKNVKALVPRWLFQYGIIDGVSNQTTPVIVDGVMYVTDPRGSVYAVNGADGHLSCHSLTDLIGGGSAKVHLRNRGAAYRRCRLHGAGLSCFARPKTESRSRLRPNGTL